MPSTKTPNLYLAGTAALLRILFLNISFVVAKKLDGSISNTLVLCIRSSCSFMILVPFFAKYKLDLVKTKKPLLHIIRGLCGAAAMYCTYYSTRQLPLAVSSTITMSLPLFITLFSFIILREKILSKQWLFLLLGYIGVAVSLRPSPSNIIDINILICLLANFFLALSIIITTLLSRSDNPVTIMFYYNFLILVIACLSNNQDINTVEIYDIILMLIIGIITIITQFCSIKSLEYSTPAFIAPFEYTRLVFAIPLGFMFFSEIPDIFTLIGAIIIVYANIMIAKLKMQYRQSSNLNNA